MFPLRDINPSRRFPVVVIGLIIVNVVVFFLEMNGAGSADSLFYQYGFIPAESSRHYWTYVTALFIHGGGGHLFSNMWFLWLFGDNVEDQMGHGRFLLFYLLSGVLAAGAHLLSDPASTIPVVGASGAIAGVMGAYLMLFKRARILTYIPPFFFFRIPAWIYLFLWLAVQITSGLSLWNEPSGEIAVWAHVGGFLAGIVFYRIFLEKDDGYYF
jgi:membrane associated rhomboid family serine protease